jgi:hypothetical protein
VLFAGCAVLAATALQTIDDGVELSPAEVAVGCRIELPASTTRPEANLTGTVDTSRDVRLEFAAADLARFVERGRFAPLQPGVSAGFPRTTFASEPWWNLEGDLAGASGVASTERDGGWLRAVLLNHPDGRVVVYLLCDYPP